MYMLVIIDSRIVTDNILEALYLLIATGALSQPRFHANDSDCFVAILALISRIMAVFSAMTRYST
jgi:hypothetical protein